jgi:hypothetical protein
LLPNYFFLVVGWREEELDGPAALEHYRHLNHRGEKP